MGKSEVAENDLQKMEKLLNTNINPTEKTRISKKNLF